ncbi:MAG: glycine cleavage system protein GcvH [Gammaproteobacteria bacterium]
MSKYPDDLKYTEEHEWVKLDDSGIATVGITDHAQNALGDIVFVELPEEGITVNAKEEVAVVESVKAASDVLSPVSGEIIAVNEKLTDAPETINTDPYDEGWFFKVQTGDTADVEREMSELMDAEAYSDFCEDE